MSDELLAQTSRLNGNDASTIPAYHRSGAYRSGIVMLVFCLIFFVLRLIHVPGGFISLIVSGIAGLVFVILTVRHLMRVAPEERLFIRFAAIACMFLVVGMVFRILHYPFGKLLVIIALSLFAVAFLYRLLKHWSQK